MNLDEQVFLTLLVYKDIIKEDYDNENNRKLRYRVLGPMMGTIEDDVFINTSDKKYYSIERGSTNMNDDIRYAYYKTISLKDAKEKYMTDNVEEVVEKFNEEYKNDSYFVLNNKDTEPIIMRYDEDKLRRKYDSDIAKPI